MKIVVFLLFSLAVVQAQDILDVFSDFLDIFQFANNINFNLDKLQEILDAISKFDPEKICEYIDEVHASEECKAQLRVVCETPSLLLTMVDASSKGIPSGSLKEEASRMDYGNFDQCISIDHTAEHTRVLGKHCTAGLVIPTTPLDDPLFFEKSFKLSTCIPDKCFADDFLNIFSIPANYSFVNDLSCSTNESHTQFGAPQITTIAIFAFFTLVVIISTTYDICLTAMDLKSRHPLFLAFSAYSNGKKLLQTTKSTSGEQIMVLHGLRVISLMWIIAGHTWAAQTVLASLNAKRGILFEWQKQSFYITSGHLAVDTFFFMSGLLISYQYLKEEEVPLKVHVKRVPFLYIHRYLRLTPALIMVYLFHTFLLDKMASGPVYHEVLKQFTQPCLDHYWSFILYTQNYVNYDNICVIQSWYLSADMQLFLMAPIVLIPIAKQVKKHFNLVMLELLFLNIVCTFVPVGLKLVFEDFVNEYDVHSRLNDYFIGFMLGVYMREKKDSKCRFEKVTNFIIWIVCLFTMLTVVLCFKEIQISIHEGNSSSIVYFIFLRGLWCLGLSWIVHSCHNSHGGIIGWFLTRPLFQGLSKLTYSMFLTHMCIICYQSFSTKTINYFSQYNMFCIWCGNYIMTIIVATYWTLMFESPLIIMEKYLFSKPSSPQNQPIMDVAVIKHDSNIPSRNGI